MKQNHMAMGFITAIIGIILRTQAWRVWPKGLNLSHQGNIQKYGSIQDTISFLGSSFIVLGFLVIFVVLAKIIWNGSEEEQL